MDTVVGTLVAIPHKEYRNAYPITRRNRWQIPLRVTLGGNFKFPHIFSLQWGQSTHSFMEAKFETHCPNSGCNNRHDIQLVCRAKFFKFCEHKFCDFGTNRLRTKFLLGFGKSSIPRISKQLINQNQMFDQSQTIFVFFFVFLALSNDHRLRTWEFRFCNYEINKIWIRIETTTIKLP